MWNIFFSSAPFIPNLSAIYSIVSNNLCVAFLQCVTCCFGQQNDVFRSHIIWWLIALLMLPVLYLLTFLRHERKTPSVQSLNSASYTSKQWSRVRMATGGKLFELKPKIEAIRKKWWQMKMWTCWFTMNEKKTAVIILVVSIFLRTNHRTHIFFGLIGMTIVFFRNW